MAMESYSLFPPVKRQTHPTNTTATMLHHSTKNISAAATKHRPGHVVFRFLCHASRTGSVIGKSGSIVKHIQQLTNSKIWVENPIDPGDEQRVFRVVSSPAIVNRVKLPAENGDEWFEVSAAQEGILRVFERVVEVATEGDSAAGFDGVFSIKLLVSKNQGGAVIGKGGMVVEKIKKETGCRISVFNSDKFSLGIDEIVEIEGSIMSLKKALVMVTGRIQEFPPPVSITNSHVSSHGPTSLGPEKIPNMSRVVFKILCPSEVVGGIIGKAGSIVKDINSKTGAIVCIGPTVAECDKRLITVTAMESVESEYSSAQKATILVFNRSIEAGVEDSRAPFVSAHVLVPVNQVGCLLGKGGSIISEMRKATRTGMWLVGGHQVPKCCASENVEVLQITGEVANVRDALYKVTGKLRDNMLIAYGRENGNSMGTDDNNVYEHRSLTESMDNLQISNRSAAIVTNTTVEIAVLDTVIGSIYGENGSNLLRLRQISGAKVMVHEPRPGTNLISVVISGTPDETQIAQSLLQAFIQE
ncbi:hypothetical protein CASFOL_035913 [Castilleja foliolosa]|uniref:K Homology domain-containing protein n=1 Tax=Castilleja foliolosa TaxID=1961234 RepID=A0ABD3BV71_9LAMI